MKTLLLLLAMSFVATAAAAQTASPVLALEEKEKQAILAADTATLKSIWAPDFTVNTPFNRVTLTSRELLDMVASKAITFSSFKRTIEHTMVRPNLVINMGSEEVVFAPGSPRAGQTVQRRFTNIWLKQNGKWWLSARHANDMGVK